MFPSVVFPRRGTLAESGPAKAATIDPQRRQLGMPAHRTRRAAYLSHYYHADYHPTKTIVALPPQVLRTIFVKLESTWRSEMMSE